MSCADQEDRSMTSRLLQLLQIQYRLQQPAGFLKLWPNGTPPDRLQDVTTGDWVACTCQHWFVVEADQAKLEQEIIKQLTLCHPTAEAVELLSYRALRGDNQFISW